ncbi:MAG: endonuclease/exonuclease/phosphatase family protein, partial [Candidatus Thiodiazotropha sp.]
MLQVDCEPDQELAVPATDPDSVSIQTNAYEVNTNGSDTLPLSVTNDNRIDLTFSRKGFHLSNLNIRHIVPKIDELRILMASQGCPDVIGLCETFLSNNIPDNQLAIDGFDFIRKDRSDTQNKAGGGIILYFRNSLNCKRRRELEISEIETLWTEIALPNSKPFLICSAYRPPSASSAWIDLFEEELSVAQTTGLEMILMGDFNIDLISCTNHKWLNLLQLFDFSQLVSEPTRVTQTSSSLIDHVYTSNPENIIECFVPFYSISDHFPVCFTRKVSCKVTKSEHTTTSYRCFKNFNEAMFLSDLSNDLSRFLPNASDIDTDFTVWHTLILKHLNSHAPIK